MATSKTRVHKGVPTGGQFDKKRTPEASVDLRSNRRQDDDTDRFHSVGLRSYQLKATSPEGRREELEALPKAVKKEIEREAADRGAEAFREGRGRLVAQQVHLDGGTLAGEAWYRGWDQANLAEPVVMDDGTVIPGFTPDGKPVHKPDKQPEAKTSNPFEGAEAISTYSRAEALKDGVLAEVDPKMAKEAGFKYPVAMTSAAHADTVEWDDKHGALQDEEGRQWDVLMTARHAITRAPAGTDRVPFQVHRVPNTPRARNPKPASLVAHIGPGDTPQPVVTIMQPGED